LRTWFPPNDKFAAHVARLCILREDFRLEMAGISAEQIATFDGNHPVWRKLYFWRNLIRTLSEIRNTLRTIEAIDEFKQIFNSQPSKWRREFKLAVKKLEEDKDLIDQARNSVGGHVQQHTVDQALNNLPADLVGDLEVGETSGKMHYKFVGELLVKMVAWLKRQNRSRWRICWRNYKRLRRTYQCSSSLMNYLICTWVRED
jgi:hypothetical protein